MQEQQNANVRVGRAVARYRGGMSQAELARQLAAKLGKANVDPTTITRIESGKRSISVDELEAFADIFGVAANDLLSAEITDVLAQLENSVSALHSSVEALIPMAHKVADAQSVARTAWESAPKNVQRLYLLRNNLDESAIQLLLTKSLVEWVGARVNDTKT